MIEESYCPAPGEAWSPFQLLPAEKILLEKAKTGDRAPISNFKPASSDTCSWADEHQIRAKVIRHLLRHPTLYYLDPKGIDIRGAYITGELDLENLKIQQQMQFIQCWFDITPLLLGARLRTLLFEACHLPGLKADRLHVEGGLFLRNSVFTGAVRLLGVQVNGNVTCNGATFTHKGTDAFNADRIVVNGNLFLNGVTVTGSTWLRGAQVTGDVDCSHATFTNPDGYAFLAQRMAVSGRLFWQGMAPQPKGVVDFTHAQVGDFISDELSWPQAGMLMLDGFVYDHLATNTSAVQSARWLTLMPHMYSGKPAFWPRPYEQAIKVFKAAGHEREAQLIANAKQDAYRSYLKARSMHDDVDGEQTTGLRLWLWFLKYGTGYDFAPSRALFASAMIILLGTLFFEAGYVTTNILPAKELAYINKCFVVGEATNTGSSDKVDEVHAEDACNTSWSPIRTQRFYQPDHVSTGYVFHLPTDYVTFQPLAYSIDVFIPILDLQQETSWMPKKGWVRLYMWFHIALGWVFTTIAVIGFTGLVKKD